MSDAWKGWSIGAVLVAVVGGALVVVFEHAVYPQSTSEPEATVVTAQAATEPSPAGSQVAPVDESSVPTASSQPSAVPVVATISSFEMWTDHPGGYAAGDRVGPNMYSLGNAGYASVSYGWRAIRSDGTFDESESCQIEARVSGPETLEAMRSAECTRGIGTVFTGSANHLQVHTPGSYTVTLVDQISGLEGKVQFQVVGP